MKRLSAMFSAVLLAGFLLLGASPDAQAPTAQPGQVQSAALSANGDTGAFSLYQATGGAIQFSGTFVGTVQFEATINGTTWNALSVTPTAGGASVTSATATGAWTFSNLGYANVRVRASAWTSGNLIAQVTTVGPGLTTTNGLFADGSASSPSISFTTDPDTGFRKDSADGNAEYVSNGTDVIKFGTSGLIISSASNLSWGSSGVASVDTILCRGAANVIGIGGCTSSFPAIKRNTTQIEFKLGDDSAFTTVKSGFFTVNSGYLIGGNMLIAVAAPTISSGFGTSPSIVSSNGPAAFLVNVGTGGVATSGVVGLPAAVTGWSCFANDRTNNTVTRQTATTTTTATFTAAAAWAASDILNISCFGY